MRYEFLWRRRYVDLRHDEGGWRSKTIRAKTDAEAVKKMLDHCGNIGRPIEIDYEMARVDVLYDHTNHAEKFLDMQNAGVELEVN